MNIIIINPISPFPADNGGRIVSFKRIYHLAQSNNVYVFYTYDEDCDDVCQNELQKYCKGVYGYHRTHNPLQVIKRICNGPYMASSRWNSKMRHDIDQCIEKNCIDTIIVEFPHMLGNISNYAYKHCKVVLELHNIEWATYALTATKISNPFKRLAYKIESKRLKRFEEKHYAKDRINLYTFVSSKDKEFFEKHYSQKTFLSPIGMDIPTTSCPPKKKDNLSIIFVGLMNYHPNVNAARWFADNVFPQLQEMYPHLTFYIVGKNPTEEVQELGKRNGIIVTGTVNSVEPYYEMADAVILPLLIGGGVKVKLLEALAHGKPVVSTSKGTEGTIVEHTKELYVADSPDDFFVCCKQALDKETDHSQMIANAKQTIEKHYSWQGILSSFQEKLNNK